MSRRRPPPAGGPGRSDPLGRRRALLVRLAPLGPLALLLLTLTGGPAAAHTDLIQGSPAATQEVGGSVEGIDLAFLDVVSEAVVVVTHDGVEVPGVMTVDEGRIVHFDLHQPLTTPGRYEVTYTVTAADGDRLQSGYFFVYEPDSPPPQPIGTPPRHDEGPAATTRVAAAGLTVVAVLGAVLLVRNWLELRRRRAATAATGSGPDDPSH